jgi:hypothetical protein
MIYVSLTNWREKYLVEQIKTAAWRMANKKRVSEVEHLVDQLADLRLKQEEELRRREHKYDQQSDSLLRQVQTMAERIAKLKIESPADTPVVDAEPTPFIPEDTAPVPYSQALFDFVSGLETDDARVMVEDYVERMRSNGTDDIQILEQLNRGEYVNG